MLSRVLTKKVLKSCLACYCGSNIDLWFDADLFVCASNEGDLTFSSLFMLRIRFSNRKWISYCFFAFDFRIICTMKCIELRIASTRTLVLIISWHLKSNVQWEEGLRGIKALAYRPTSFEDEFSTCFLSCSSDYFISNKVVNFKMFHACYLRINLLHGINNHYIITHHRMN